MHLKDNIKSFICDQNYFIGIYSNYIYLFNYVVIDKFSEQELIIHFDNFKLTIEGTDFLVCRMLKNEVLIKGIIKEFKIDYE